ncbi:TonB-dependent receptor [Paracidobacterium acidisoli]|uniref:TonB-dependent receptor n=1 Tax=Paracidobacterium acidisoli TaxID=2303751 RepID=A0A372IL82_9BACT|nr:TonB-dependent receptor [Paracidobacterium acidisoli]MBT9332297.1 TonB-dependent receptor [Paracidobacterium acidisoli]
MLCLLAACLLLTLPLSAQSTAIPVWQGVVRQVSGQPVAGATVELALQDNRRATTTKADGSFSFVNIQPGRYLLTVRARGRAASVPLPIDLSSAQGVAALTLTDENVLSIPGKPPPSDSGTKPAATGGEQLSSQSVSELPLNKRDISQLLLLAAGTMTDSNGATNFTQQFAINGQRGVEAAFAMDGADISDPEMGGATFTNFNVDAVQEIQSSSGWMPAEIGRGASGFTNIITRSGSSGFHGSVFEFVRNSAFDARNYFDHPSIAEPGRIPPFRRNEFGFTNGGPVVLPHLYDGRGKTFYFGQYQGFRQVLGTTQVLPMPTASERAGFDTVTYADGSTDTLTVPVNPQIAAVLARYPMPNNPMGTYQARTYAAPSKVATDADQFSIRLDQKLGEKGQFFARFNFDNLTGPTTNPDQTTIDPSFGVQYVDRQRNVVFTYTRTVSPRFLWESSLSITRTTPSFPTPNRTDPALKFNDGLYEAFNSAAGSVMSSFGNLFQARQNFTWTTKRHALKAGAEVRLNRDTTYFGISPNGEYDFGGGTVYSPIFIPSMSGTHDVQPGDPLPDTLSSLLIGYPYSYTVAVAPPYFSNGAHIGPAAINRNNFTVYAQDTWKLSERFVLDYGLRYEVYSPISERAHRTSSFLDVHPPAGVSQQYLINPQPGYRFGWNGWGPRVQLDWRATSRLHIHAGGGITVIPPNIWQDNFLTGSTPFAVYPRVNTAKNGPIRYGFQITPAQLPRVYTPAGQDIFASSDTKKVPANTVMDVDRYQKDMAALSPDHQLSLLNISAVDRHFGNGFLQTWTLGAERRFGGLTADAAYVGTASYRLPRISYPNGYPGAEPAFAPYTQFDASGAVSGGFGFEQVITDNSHSSYHALQTSLSGTAGHGGPGIQASYTWSKSLDDTSTVTGGTGSTGAVTIPSPQNPFDTHPEKGPSTFDTAHAFTLSLAQDLHAESLGFLHPVSRKVTAGWEMLSISTITSGAPFTVYSGIQQTGVGTYGADRPDQIAKPHLSTTHSATRPREDYFGEGTNNASFFHIPTGIAGGTGPNSGRFGTLGRNTFRGPAYYDFDFAFIKDTPFGHRRSGAELMDLQFRSELFNLFNIVNMGLPANTIKGSGFGEISKTAGTSRQIQFSLKLIY